MKTTRWSLLLAGLASMSGGCQPEEPVQAPVAALESQKAALTVGTWTLNASSLFEHASGPTATLLNGPGDVLVADGSGAEVYNPYTNTWRRTASMSTPRSSHTATELPSGKVLVTGGYNASSERLRSAELYDPATGTWSPTGTMTTPRSFHTAVRLDSGKVLVVGGGDYYRDYEPLDPTGEVYDPDTGTWSAVQGSFIPRFGASATVLYSGKVLVTGGYVWWSTEVSKDSDAVNIYDPATNSWSPAGGKLARARYGHSAIRLYSGKVLILGGVNGGNTVELYDPNSGQWSLGPPFPYELTPISTATMLYSGEVLVTDAAYQAALYDPTTNSWLPTPGMNTNRFRSPTTRLHTGEVLFVGGGSNSRSVERFTR